MIHELTGDLLLSEANLIAHGVAPGDHFTSGLALALRERWPSMAKDFRHWCHLNHPKAGGVWSWSGPNVHIACLLTQDQAEDEGGTPGRASTANVNHALRALKASIIAGWALRREGESFRDWAEGKPLIEHHLGGLGIPVYVYSHYVGGQKATEPKG